MAMKEEAHFQNEMQEAQIEFQQALPSSKLHELAKSKKPPESWYQEDFSYLDSDAS